MILVNDNWEMVYDLQDISNIIREYYNRDLADELDKLIPEYTDEEFYDLECELNNRYDEISTLEDEYSSLESENKRLEERIEELENELSSK
jgi:predicted  nucleic acid-binding Zn-ribbon protein